VTPVFKVPAEDAMNIPRRRETMLRADYSGAPFVARDSRGTPLTVTPFYQLRTVAGAMQAALGLPQDCVGLRADDGRMVERLGFGSYTIGRGDLLTSSDPNAV
jgi:hypothetical protein